jgi:hypothetical protein
MLNEKLRWSTIDGKCWTAIDSSYQFEITLEEGESDVYTAIAIKHECKFNPEDIEYSDTIQQAKDFCEAYRK